MRAEYDPWAAYYDWIHQGLPGEAEFYILRALRRGGHTLELGCGTGRVCLPLAMSGGDVVGLDLSVGMLAECQEKRRLAGPLTGRLHLVQGDMRRFSFARRFHTIMMPYRTFMHLLTVQDQCECLTSVREHLASGGEFILNLWAARPSVTTEQVRKTSTRFRLAGQYPVPSEGLLLRHFHRVRIDEAAQRLDEDHRIEEVNLMGSVQRRRLLHLDRVWVTPREMEHLLCRCGFEVSAVYGDFEERQTTNDSTEMIWVAMRKN
ncbi:MAG: class I SAM-dependent methyltransferase [Candidatus Hydrogenedentes bacterium]|nr:class I SAM-dependent methyltransferase [Candidatus Hydrogenedentota bacterium]